jgi:hypothetical protein
MNEEPESNILKPVQTFFLVSGALLCSSQSEQLASKQNAELTDQNRFSES